MVGVALSKDDPIDFGVQLCFRLANVGINCSFQSDVTDYFGIAAIILAMSS